MNNLLKKCEDKISKLNLEIFNLQHFFCVIEKYDLLEEYGWCIIVASDEYRLRIFNNKNPNIEYEIRSYDKQSWIIMANDCQIAQVLNIYEAVDYITLSIAF